MMSGQLDALGEVVTEDVVHEMPQTNERTRGIANFQAIFENSPESAGPFGTESIQILGDEPRYFMTPTFSVVRVEGSGDNPIVVMKVNYGDGTRWWLVNFFNIRDGKVAKWVQYWAPVEPAPAWRAPWVEPIE
jgi:ketosteroid isomerase-like protein